MFIWSTLAKVKVLSMCLHLSKMKKTRVTRYGLVRMHDDDDIGKHVRNQKVFL
jgi:hypothetical protein